MSEPSDAMRAILDDTEYVDLDPHKSVLDGRFTADELRTIADEMDRIRAGVNQIILDRAGMRSFPVED